MGRRKEYDLFSMEENREKWRLKVKTAVMTLGKTFSYTPSWNFSLWKIGKLLEQLSENCETYVYAVVWLRWHYKQTRFSVMLEK